MMILLGTDQLLGSSCFGSARIDYYRVGYFRSVYNRVFPHKPASTSLSTFTQKELLAVHLVTMNMWPCAYDLY